jgi:CheY-like chemotaxis protein
VKADRVQLEQVILNLAVNARDAMPGGGTLTLETTNVVLDEPYVLKHTGSKMGPHVLLSISDTGHGMNRETQAHLFEPFFTTKGPGKGTGLGLAMAYGIIKQSGGNIWAISAPGKGTRFEIYLPRMGETPARSSGLIRAVPDGKSRAGSATTVLLVEDEEPVRELTRKFLEEAGYTVLEARSCSEAILLHERNKDAVKLLLTDVVMPKMSGRDLAGILTKAHPGLKVLYMSGYTDNVLGERGIMDTATAFLAKPFTQETLARKVAEVLETGAGAK